MSLIFKLVSRYNWLNLKYTIPFRPVVLELFFILLRCTYPMWLINQSSKVDLSIYRSYPSNNKIKSLNKIPYTYCRHSKRIKSWKIIRLVMFFWKMCEFVFNIANLELREDMLGICVFLLYIVENPVCLGKWEQNVQGGDHLLYWTQANNFSIIIFSALSSYNNTQICATTFVCIQV